MAQGHTSSAAGDRDTEETRLVTLLRSAARVQAAETVQEALQRMAEAVHQSGWDAVVSCMYDGWERTHLAIVGLSEDEVQYTNTHQPTPQQRAQMYGELFEPYKLSRSYFLTAEDLAALQAAHGERPLVPGRPHDKAQGRNPEWDPGDVAYLPLCATDGSIIGAISLDRPTDDRRPTRETFEHLEFFADLAARTIEQIRDKDQLKAQRDRERIVQHQVEAASQQLAHLLRAAAFIQSAQTVQEALEHIADAATESGWESAIVCLFDETWALEQMSHRGLTEQQVEFVHQNQPTADQRAAMYGEEFAPYRISRSYFLTSEQVRQRDDQSRAFMPSAMKRSPDDTWDTHDVAYIPLSGRRGRVIGTISLDCPADGQRPTRETFEHLEFYADLAARTIERIKDHTELNRVTSELREREARLRVIYAQIPALIWTTNRDQVMTSMAGSQLERVGLTEADFVGCTIAELARRGGSDEPIEMHDRALGGESVTYDYPWLDVVYKVHLEPLRDERQNIIGCVGVGLDITDLIIAGEELEQRSHREHLLLRELDHRVRNNLSALIALVDLTKNRAANMDDFATAIRGRISAMATVHSLLARSRWSSTDLGRLIRGLVPADLHQRVSCAGAPLMIPASQVTALSIVLHELITNSAKYGALARAEGAVGVSWETTQLDDQTSVRLRWREPGGQPPGKVTAGTGTRLIEGLARSDLHGHVEFRYLADGVDHELVMRLDMKKSG